MKGLVGIIPAAGLGKRMQLYYGPKELLSVGYQTAQVGLETTTIPKVVSQYVLEGMQCAGTKNILIVVSAPKLEILKFYENGTRFDLNIAYLCQEVLGGMPGALDLAYSWVDEQTVLMGMPDTILEPADCFACLLDLHAQRHADLSLGIFPVTNPQQLAPVQLEPETECVLQILDKPRNSPFFNSWGIAVWAPTFTRLLHEFVEARAHSHQELLLSDVFSEAITRGLRVYGHFFPDGKYYDVGTPEGLLRTRYDFECSTTVATLEKEHLSEGLLALGRLAEA